MSRQRKEQQQIAHVQQANFPPLPDIKTRVGQCSFMDEKGVQYVAITSDDRDEYGMVDALLMPFEPITQQGSRVAYWYIHHVPRVRVEQRKLSVQERIDDQECKVVDFSFDSQGQMQIKQIVKLPSIAPGEQATPFADFSPEEWVGQSCRFYGRNQPNRLCKGLFHYAFPSKHGYKCGVLVVDHTKDITIP